MKGTALPHARGLPRLALLALIFAVFGQPTWPQNPGQESWAGPFDWEAIISEYDPDMEGYLLCPPDPMIPTQPGGGNRELEFSHAAVMPTGNFAGWVLLWRKEIETDPTSLGFCKPNCTQNTSTVWAFNPANPAGLIRIKQPPGAPQLSSNLFCGGVSWDRLGQLVIAGGTPAGCDGNTALIFPAETYRFRPNALAYTQVQPGGEISMKFSKHPF